MSTPDPIAEFVRDWNEEQAEIKRRLCMVIAHVYTELADRPLSTTTEESGKMIMMILDTMTQQGLYVRLGGKKS